MKNQSATNRLKRLLILVFVCFSALGFSQTNDLGIDKMKNSPEITYDFMGTDLIIQPPPGINELNLVSSGLNPVLKGAVVNQSRLDSILEMTNYGIYSDRKKWQFNYDNNNRLKTSSRLFFDIYNTFGGVNELREYDENGQMLSLVRSGTQIEQYQYINGNLVEQIIFESSDIRSFTGTKTFTYNEKNQLIKILEVTKRLDYSQTTHYLYDQDGRKKYKIYGFWAYRNDYTVTDTTMVIQERKGAITNYKQPSDLDRIKSWKDGNTYLLNLDQSGRTISIEKSYFDISQNIKYTYFRVEYEYTSTGKLKQSTYYLPDDQLNFKSWYKSTIIKNLYNADDNLLEYEKTFYDTRVNGWVVEESKTYYYNLIKNAVTGNNQNRTNDFYIYPNPATDCIYFSITPEVNSNYIIYNLLGEVVAQGDFDSPSISISKLTSGTYFIKVDKNGVGFVNRFLKK
jgi:hypothetical protein